MSNIALTIEAINQLQPLEVVTNPTIRDRFIYIYDTLWGAGTGEAAYERESFFFNNKLRENARLQTATRFSIFTCFIDLAIAGLSLEPGARAQCYLQGRSVCIGTDANNKRVYEPRLNLTISGYGELVMRTRAGQIRHADNPILVYEEDTFSFGDMNGQKIVNYMCKLPHTTNHIVAAFMRITRADGSVDYAVMLEEDWIRLMEYSGENNKYYDDTTRKYVLNPNKLYTSRDGAIDTGFLVAKLIKHAFKTYPKVRIGKNSELESQQDDNAQQNIDDFYGTQPEQSAQPAPQELAPLPPMANFTTHRVAAPTNAVPDDDGAF